MHSDFYDNPASENIRLREEVSELRRYVDALKKYARMVTELYTELNSKNKELSAQLGKDTNVPSWISAEEDVPLNDDDVLVLLGGKDIAVGWFDGYKGCWHIDGSVAGKVTHWMPAPGLPKEG